MLFDKIQGKITIDYIRNFVFVLSSNQTNGAFIVSKYSFLTVKGTEIAKLNLDIDLDINNSTNKIFLLQEKNIILVSVGTSFYYISGVTINSLRK
jgi:hypothetical protein